MTTIIVRKISKKAFLDPLTGLEGYSSFDRLGERLLKKNPHTNYVLAELDIYNFKFINTRYGMTVGDEILVQFADKLSSLNAGGDLLCARGYADHFFILQSVKSPESIFHNIERLSKMEFFLPKKQLIPLKIKTGLVFTGRDYGYDSVKNLLGKVSIARKSMKQGHMGYVVVFDTSIEAHFLREQMLESKMKNALAQGHFLLYLQPKISLETGKICGAEALVRWNDPDFGLINPDGFIPLFERNGFIEIMDFYILNRVLIFLQAQIDLGNPVLPISINFSRMHLQQNSFLSQFLLHFNDYNISPDLLEVEITENAFDGDVHILKKVSSELKHWGFKVSIDDFGAGYSSLNILKDLPIDMLKLDKVFLQEVHTSANTSIIICQLIQMAKKIGLATLCEGVETAGQVEFLKFAGCDQAQGFYYAPPLPVDDFIHYALKHS